MKKMILTLLGTLAFPAIAFAHPGMIWPILSVVLVILLPALIICW